MRQQLQDRVQRYRSRQKNRTPSLPFEEELEPPVKVLSFPAASIPFEEKIRVPPIRPARVHRAVEAENPPAPQPVLDFHRGALQDHVWRSLPVAPVRRRVSAHLKDLMLIVSAAILFLAALQLIPCFGVAIHPNLILLDGVVCGSLLMTLLYGLLFVWGAGVTPGMKSAGLRLVTFDGLPAPRQQRLWRIFGGIVSAGSFLIGFLWAAVDEETLYWHDHISKTYLTPSDPLS